MVSDGGSAAGIHYLAATPSRAARHANRIYRATRGISDSIAGAVGQLAAQLGVIVICLLWWGLGGSETALV